MLRYIGGERLVVGEELFPHGFQAPVARRLLRRVPGERVELRADRRRIDVAHQAADVLQLPPLALVALGAFRFEHRLAQLVGDLHRGELRLGKLYQRDTERLQLVHLFLALSFADRWRCGVLHLVIIAPPCRSATGSPSMPPSSTTWPSKCSRTRSAPARAAAIAKSRRPTVSPSR